MGELALRVERLGKRYRIGTRESYRTLREVVSDAAKAPIRILTGKNVVRSGPESIWAVKDLSFDIKHGDVLGIIGRNGAGKSTLLKMLARITEPTEGRAEIRGRVGSLLEVGTGFHNELTGRENIFLSGAILGMRKAEIKAKFDEIVAFAEVEQFLDTPVKNYSSGMYIRLAFAVAAHLEPEILIVDEVLAVGDLAFQKKCLGKMNDVSRGGRTVIFVSHNMAAIENICRRGFVMQQGKLVFNGAIQDAIGYYYNQLSATPDPDGHIFDLEKASDRVSLIGRFLKRVELYTTNDEPVTEGLRIGAPLRVRIYFDLPKPTTSFDMGLGFNNMFGQRVFTAHTFFEPDRHDEERVGEQVFVCDIPTCTFTPGTYTTRLWLDIGNTEADLIEDACRLSVIESDFYGTGKVPWNGAFVLNHRWYLEETANRRHLRVSELERQTA